MFIECVINYRQRRNHWDLLPISFDLVKSAENLMVRPRDVFAFGQADPTDNRGVLEWQSKYSDPAARAGIRIEAIYLGLLLFGMPLLMCLLWLELP
jgi:hypothetical protein